MNSKISWWANLKTRYESKMQKNSIMIRETLQQQDHLHRNPEKKNIHSNGVLRRRARARSGAGSSFRTRRDSSSIQATWCTLATFRRFCTIYTIHPPPSPPHPTPSPTLPHPPIPLLARSITSHNPPSHVRTRLRCAYGRAHIAFGRAPSSSESCPFI